MKLEEYLLEIEKFLKDYLEKSHCAGYVLGISGGVDSSLVALIAQKAIGNDRLHCLILPITSQKADADDALALVKKHNLNYTLINGDEIEASFLKSFKEKGLELDRLTVGNLKARIRMSILYAYAQKHNLLVLGTDNADERYTGYFTKYGDGGVDVLPIAHLTKHEVVEASLLYGMDERLAKRVPTAGLFEGQTDENEMGISYKDLDNYLLGNEVSLEAKAKIERLHRISEHKRVDIPTPKPFNRDVKK